MPDSPLCVPEGTRVEIELSPPGQPAPRWQRQGGWWRGQMHIAPDFDELPPDIENDRSCSRG